MSDTLFIPRDSDSFGQTHPGYVRIKDPPERKTTPLAQRRFWILVMPSLVAVVFLVFQERTLTRLTEFRQAISASVANPASIRQSGVPWLFSSGLSEPNFSLNGIVYSPARPVAMINQRPFGRDEIGGVMTDNGRQPIHCLEIRPADVRIRVPGGEEVLLNLTRD